MLTKKKWIFIFVVSFVVLTVGTVYLYFGGFTTGKTADVEAFKSFATSVSELDIPSEVEVIALGEATHGNVEFQELKLEVLQVLVERYGVKSFALEEDAGRCELINRYVSGENATTVQTSARDVLKNTIQIYNTQQMENLLDWIKAYNQKVSANERILFYGFDCQNFTLCYQLLVEELQKHDVDTLSLEAVFENTLANAKAVSNSVNYYFLLDESEVEKANSILKEIIAGLEILGRNTFYERYFASIIMQNLQLSLRMKNYSENPGGVSVLRDEYMKENVLKILEHEKSRGNSRTFITAHNGHIAKHSIYKNTGTLLAEHLKEGYYAIGTDFYKASVNLPNAKFTARTNKTFYSHNPIAKACAKAKMTKALLDFAKIDEAGMRKLFIGEYIPFGSLGEGYTFMMRILPQSYRPQDIPERCYNAMIFVANAKPIVVR